MQSSFGNMFVLLFLWWIVAQISGFIPTEKTGHVNQYWTSYVDKNYSKMVTFLRKSNNSGILDCYTSGDSFLIKNSLKKQQNASVFKVNKETMIHLIDICTYGKWNGIFTGQEEGDLKQDFGIFSGLFIYPGTKWCGAGNISESYDDLGPEIEADMCCRTHDHCNDSIAGYNLKYGLENNSPVTKSHCDCDELFHLCLYKAKTKASNRIGRIFFNFLQMDCFRQHFPIIGCRRYHGRIRRRCQEYEHDSAQEPFHQFFDAKHYEPNSDEDEDDNEIETHDIFSYILKLEKQSS